MTACLLVGMLVVPSAAADDVQMYSYNGIELPALPVWSQSAYPYALICGKSGQVDGVPATVYYFYVFDTEVTVNSANNLEPYGGYAACSWKLTPNDTDWVLSHLDVQNAQWGVGSHLGVIWSSFDVYREGVLDCAASVPLPVSDSESSGDGSSGDSSGSSCDCPDYTSILSSLLSAITTQTNFLSTWQQTWTTRMDSIETTLSKLIPVPDPTETALKEATSDVVDAYTEQFWSESGAGFGRSGIEDAGIVFQHSKKMFDTGVSVSDFFGLFDAYGWGNWFSAETRDDLDTVPKPAVIDDGEDSELSTYEKNLQEIQSFVGGG